MRARVGSPTLPPVNFAPHEIIWLLVLGLAAGALGGMLGIGGSVIMIPVLTWLFGQQHLSQAVAMIVNVCVSLPALLQHHRAKAVRWSVVGRMLPAGIAFILVGVEASNHMDGKVLEKLFGAFLLYMVATNVYELVAGKAEPEPHEQRTDWLRMSAIGSATGFTAGLLGIGGGNIAVPLLQRFASLPLRQCIATTAAFMCVSASIGAVRKNLALSTLNLGLSWQQSLAIAAFLAPTAVLGGLIGGRLTHALPLTWVRVAFILLLLWAGIDMLGFV